MDGLNHVTIGGNLTRDPELKAAQSGTAVLSFSVAVNESRKRGDGWEDVPSYVDVTMFGKRAESLSRFLRKGVYVAVTGKLRQERWQAKDGTTRSKLGVIADNVHFETRGETVQPAQPQWSAQQAYAKQPATTAPVYDEDIPF